MAQTCPHWAQTKRAPSEDENNADLERNRRLYVSSAKPFNAPLSIAARLTRFLPGRFFLPDLASRSSINCTALALGEPVIAHTR